MSPEPERRFVFAPDMAKLQARVKEAEDRAESAQEAAQGAVDLLEDMEAASDLLARLSYLVLAVRDFHAGLLDGDELYERARTALDGVRDRLPDFIMAELGVDFAKDMRVATSTVSGAART